MEINPHRVKIEINPCPNCKRASLKAIATIYSIVNAAAIYFLLKCGNKRCRAHGWLCAIKTQCNNSEDSKNTIEIQLQSSYIFKSTRLTSLTDLSSFQYLILDKTVPLHIPSNLPEIYRSFFKEAYKCYNNNCYRACALMARVIIERVLIDKGAKPTEGLADMIKQTLSQASIHPELIDLCEDIRVFGNKAAHDVYPVAKGDAETCLQFADIVISLFHSSDNVIYLDDERLSNLS